MTPSMFDTDFLVIDDFLERATFAAIWNSFGESEFVDVHKFGFQKAFGFGDGSAFRSETNSHYERIFDADTQRWRMVLDDTHNLTPLLVSMLNDQSVGQFLDGVGEWTSVSLHSYIYPPGAGLSWHTDRGKRAAFIYYAHPEWCASWGGELLVATRKDGSPNLPGYSTSRFDEFHSGPHSGDFRVPSTGIFIQPMPNRLVLVAGGTPHAIKKVEPLAGIAFRASVSGFFS